MKSLAALSLVSGIAVGGDTVDHVEQKLDHPSEPVLASTGAPPEHFTHNEAPVAPSYVGWDKFNSLDGDGFKN